MPAKAAPGEYQLVHISQATEANMLYIYFFPTSYENKSLQQQ